MTIWQLLWGFVGLTASTAAILVACMLIAAPFVMWGKYVALRKERDDLQERLRVALRGK